MLWGDLWRDGKSFTLNVTLIGSSHHAKVAPHHPPLHPPRVGREPVASLSVSLGGGLANGRPSIAGLAE